jgi:uncharacterized delta-60 repeat protein
VNFTEIVQDGDASSFRGECTGFRSSQNEDGSPKFPDSEGIMVKPGNFSANHYFTGGRWFGISVVALAFLASVSMATAQAGRLDKTFGKGGLFLAQSAGLSNTQATAVAIQSDGKIVVAGQAPSQVGAPEAAVLRLTANGSLDSSFGQEGVAIVNFGAVGGELATGVVIQRDGKIVIEVSFGTADGVAELDLARLNADGALDTGFGSGGTVQVFRGGPDTAYVALQPDGKLLVGGGLLMARVNPDGSLDSSFGQKGIAPLVAPASSIVLQANGQILAVTNGNGGLNVPPADGGIIRYNANGTVDTSFGMLGRTASVVGTTSALLQSNGQIVAAGPIISKAFVAAFPAVPFDSEFGLVRYASNGSIDTTFGKHGLVLTDFSSVANFAVPNTLAIELNGDIIAAGQAAQSTASSLAVTRYTPTGAIDTTFGSGGKVLTAFGTSSAAIAAVTPDSDGRLVAVGNVDVSFPSSGSIVVARYLTQ